MATGILYDVVLEKLGPAYTRLIARRGMDGKDEEEVSLELLGYENKIHYQKLVMSPHWATVQFVKNILWGRRAIIIVKSKNYNESEHAIYWDGELIHDPSNAKKFEWNEVEPIEFFIFTERMYVPLGVKEDMQDVEREIKHALTAFGEVADDSGISVNVRTLRKIYRNLFGTS
jgi:hypothetical protein